MAGNFESETETSVIRMVRITVIDAIRKSGKKEC